MTSKEKPPQGSISLCDFLDKCDEDYFNLISSEEKNQNKVRSRIKEFISRKKIKSFKKPGKSKNSMEFILSEAQIDIKNIYKNMWFLRKKGIYFIGLSELSEDLHISLQQTRRIFRVCGGEYLLSNNLFEQSSTEFFLEDYSFLNLDVKKDLIKNKLNPVVPYFKYIQKSSKKFVSSNVKRDLKICLDIFLKQYSSDNKENIFDMNWYENFAEIIKKYKNLKQ